ncbi:hypothetical protein [Paraburkholderia terrae]|uniref:hypothetical protein n=1 Tax=Paraburkholderia terrae TaxID=311230 RepID=UPI001EE1B797|nr:hypothetical protein [Paraburkholderia terrae]GJH05057.1 hypothetical protein CBA19C8_30890 [Paraburkholderia terrae]
MSEQQTEKHDPTWSQIPPAGQKIRYEWYESRHEKLLEIAQRQTESISKFLLLINSGGAAAVLAAMAQKPDLHLQWTLVFYVGGIVATGLALAATYYRYICTIDRLTASFSAHVDDKTGWNGLMDQIDEKSWKGLPLVIAKCTDALYWVAFFLFIVGSVKGWLMLSP